MARPRISWHTRWIFFLCSIVFNLALIYAFIPESGQQTALIFLASTIVITGPYVLKQKAKARRTFLASLRDAEIPGWGESIVFDEPKREWAGPIDILSYACWKKDGNTVWMQRRVPTGPMGKPEVVIFAELSKNFPGNVVVFVQPLPERKTDPHGPRVRGRFTVETTNKPAASGYFDKETWAAVQGLVALEDPLTRFFMSWDGNHLTISLQGELEDEKTVQAFLEHSFRIVDRATAFDPGNAHG